MTAYNKWNKKTYEVLNVTDTEVTLKDPNGRVFSIQKSEYFFSYIENNT